MKVFGIDIIHGSVRSRGERPSFALVIREDGQERETTEVSVFRLLRLIDREKPDILAVDSVQEIARDQKALFSFLQSLPPQTMLVQSTGGEKQQSLPRVAARYNMKFNRFDPYAEARASAVVADLGGGAVRWGKGGGARTGMPARCMVRCGRRPAMWQKRSGNTDSRIRQMR